MTTLLAMELFKNMVHSIFEGITGYNFQKYCILSLMIDFVLANSLDPDEMPCYVVFHLSFQCFQNCPFRGSQSTKG